MNTRAFWVAVGILAGTQLVTQAFSVVKAKTHEEEIRNLWSAGITQFKGPAPLAFGCDGKSSVDLPGGWTKEEKATTDLPEGGTQRETVYRQAAANLEIRVIAQHFGDFPAVEWVAHIKNTGATESPLLERIQAVDQEFSPLITGPATLHWANGGVASFDDFAPKETALKPGEAFALRPNDGRSSSEVLPFFNLRGTNGGVMLALGWSGRWAAEFTAQTNGQVRVRAGQALTHLRLHPGESIRTPSVLALFYEGDVWRGQNLLRRFILAHHRPQRDGKPMVSPITCGNWGGTRAAVHLDNIRQFIQHDLPIEYYWIDAGWYGNPNPDVGAQWSGNTGRWNVRSDLYPDGFKPLSDVLRKSGRQLMVWFEPERVNRDTPWHQEHAAWMTDLGQGNLLMDLGNPQACQFVSDFVSSKIDAFGLGCYRQDFNCDPRPFWEKRDTPERQGISEIRHVEGLYRFWDNLRQKHPGLIIDNCASGGRRLDLETAGRATPFWRTDGPRDPIAHQCHTYGLMAWLPLSATSQDIEGDDYEFRSSMSSSLCINWAHSGDGPQEPIRADFPWAWAKRTLSQYLSIRDYYYGDYYPLTPYSKAEDEWMAYQLDRPELGDGLIVTLRRPKSIYEVIRLPLHEIKAAAKYAIKNLDDGQEIQLTGEEMAKNGVPVALRKKPDSALLVYRQIK